MCLGSLFWPPLWWAYYLAGAATASACLLSPGGKLSQRSRLLSLHVETLRLRANAGKRPPYAMLLPRLRPVKRD